ncbi:HAD family hydrolase [Paracoccus cavernae]|uniref:HAD family hydrolase n=2 Tax=Paracoccus cavernae TaxID=1571207 RepID=UPI0035F34E98
MRHIEAILFDCDGVLLDSEPMGCGALAQALTAAGYPMTIDEARAVFSGNAAHDSRDWMAARGLLADEIVRESDRLLFEQFDQHVPLIPGIERIMSGFSVPMAICSNASIERLKRSVHRTSLAPRFGPNIYSAEHVARPKPAADLALYACARLGVPPSRALFIDDNIHGIHCARAAGCLAVGFIAPSENRTGHAATLRAAGANHVVHGMEQFHALLKFLTIETLEDA